ncbi:hypothetical protein NTE_03555 [Candidatus Nitrososphaera evergladensis SR1]|jgi:hypothetical protein|uniref:Nucleotidyltransferase n=1 Tax=Candidatus Nitrososphaera evergladensis SR1 TaxID=1459636 RepID=A0A075MWT8_9ARCH|nr:hypothetical protein [Candidatus Nitrososphaera evergladensis]AIF85583.1 hypothetical protein NTE_03555 [Candidatus Nitrososphaera evergladensis SR1]
MKIGMSGGKIKLNKELNDLDKLVLDFVKILDRNKVNYVLVSGYVSILFGRSRSSEDIDLIVEKISKKKFLALWKEISKGFDCITTDDPENAYRKYLAARAALRFSRTGEVIPNMEFKFPKVRLESWVLGNGMEVLLNRRAIRISPVELQIPYKLFLASEKDIEDARYLYRLFKEKLDQELLKYFLKKLDKEGAFNKYLQ